MHEKQVLIERLFLATKELDKCSAELREKISELRELEVMYWMDFDIAWLNLCVIGFFDIVDKVRRSAEQYHAAERACQVGAFKSQE